MCLLSHVSHVWLFATPWTVAHQAPLSMGFSRQEGWSGLPCPPPGDLPDPGMEPASFMSPALAGGVFTTSTTWEAFSVLQKPLLCPKLQNLCLLLTNSKQRITVVKWSGSRDLVFFYIETETDTVHPWGCFFFFFLFGLLICFLVLWLAWKNFVESVSSQSTALMSLLIFKNHCFYD